MYSGKKCVLLLGFKTSHKSNLCTLDDARSRSRAMNLWSLYVFRSAWCVQVLSPECSTHMIKDT
jgi:hypothetical protein